MMKESILEKRAPNLNSAVQRKSSSLALMDNRNSDVIQLRTRVTWTMQNFTYNDKLGSLKTQRVGSSMLANLDPTDKKTGNKTTSKEMPELFKGLKSNWNPGSKKWVRGHLLNDHLGGTNTDANLFPITGHANGDHLHYVEGHVKNWMRAGRPATYQVIARQQGGNVKGLRNAAGYFLCTAYTTDAAPRAIVKRVIYSNPVPKTKKKVGHTSGFAKFNIDNSAAKGNSRNFGLPAARTGLGKKARKLLLENQKQVIGGRTQYVM